MFSISLVGDLLSPDWGIVFVVYAVIFVFKRLNFALPINPDHSRSDDASGAIDIRAGVRNKGSAGSPGENSKVSDQPDQCKRGSHPPL